MAASSGQQLEPDRVEARWNIASSASQKANCPDISNSATPQEVHVPGQDTRPTLKVTFLGSQDVVEKQPFAGPGVLEAVKKPCSVQQYRNIEEKEVSGTNEDAITLSKNSRKRSRSIAEYTFDSGPSKGSFETSRADEQQLLHVPSEKGPQPKKRAFGTNQESASFPSTVIKHSYQNLSDDKQEIVHEILHEILMRQIQVYSHYHRVSTPDGVGALIEHIQKAYDLAVESYCMEFRMPSYVVARGPKAIAAYLKAKESGTILDTRVKVLLIGQDRVGKTSVGRSLKGEQFRNNETSTDGVQMHKPFQNPGKQPWKNFTMKQETTAYHHKCAEYIGRELNAGPTVEQAPQQELETELPVGISRRLAPDENQASFETTMPDKIAHLILEKVDEMESNTPDGIWPVIWDFAGQAVYRAIHPIFMSPEAVYVLVCDLTKDLFTTALCKVKEDGREEREIPTPDSGDTNLDHILRWMDLVHSLRQSESEYKLPPVVLVGTHADEVGYPEKKIDGLKNFLMCNAQDFFKRIAKTLTINNTLAGCLSIEGEEDPQIVRLRQEILTVAETMPHTKEEVPLKWLEVENKVYDHVKEKNEKYMSKQKFKMEIFDKICQPELEDNLEYILNFLHDRGTIVHHDRPENPDGLIVLDPQWLIKDVLCKIITAKQQKEDESDILLLRKDLEDKGILHEALLHHACRNLELVHIKESLIYIMKKFNLLFERKGKNEKTAYLVPCMLTSKPTEDMMSNVFQGCNPVFITFSTNYVPFGLFTRLLVIFGEWAASRTSCEEPQLFAEAARFVIGEITCLIISCCKTVIKIHIYTMDNSNPVETEPGIASEVYRILQDALQRLRDECHWLGTVSWKLCGQCKLCPGKVDPKSRKCFRHQEPKCSHDDCAHYVPIRRSHFCCQDGKGPDLRIPHTWIQALSSDVAFQKQSCNKGKRTAGSGLEELSHDPLPIKRLRIANYSVKEGTPSNDELEDLSRRVTDVWVSLGRRLNFNEAEISAFDEENKKCSEKAYKMLLCWRQREGEDATYQILYYALCHKLVERKELAEKLCCDENLLS